MLRKFNTLVRLLIVGLLIYPFPIAFAVEQTVNEGFEDSTYESGFTISATSDPVQIYSAEIDNYGTTGASLGVCHMNNSCTAEYTFEFSSDIDVYYVSFIVGAANQAFSVTWHYSDDTTDVVNFAAQSNSNLSTMYDTVTKTLVDYNADENNTDIYVTKFVLDINDWSLFDTLVFKYDDSTATGSFATTTTTSSTTTVPTVGVPTNFSVTKNDNGSITVDWDAPTTGNTTPDRYTVRYGDNGVLDQNPNTTDTEMTFTRSDLETALGLSNSEDIAYMFSVKAENISQSIESAFTDVVTITIGKSPSGVGNNYTITESTSGITVDWDAPTSNWVDIGGYRILVAETYDADYSANTWFEVYRSTDTSTTEFTLPWVDNNDAIDYGTLNGTYYYRISTCASSWWCNDVEATYTVDNTLGPPMNPTVENVYNSGVLVKWDAANTGTRTATTYELYYRTSAENETVVYNLTETSYTIPYGNIANGTWEFSIRGYNSVYNVYSGYSTEPSLEVFNQKAQDDWEEEERKRKEREEAERRERERLEELQRQRDKNLSETGYSETDQERSDREYREEQERLAELQRQRDKNAAETGYSETDDERADREYQEEQDRLAELQRQRDKNFSETGYSETDQERADREQAEYEAEQKRIEEEIKNTVILPATTDGEELTEEEQEQVDLLVDTIIELKETLDLEVYEVEEEIFEIEEVVIIIPTTTTTTTTIPIVEDFPDEEDELELDETDTLDSEKGDQKVQPTELTDEEVEELVEVVEEKITEVVEVEELTEVFEDKEIEIIEEDELETLSEEEVEAYEEAVEEAVAEVVKELPTEKKVEVVKEVAKVSVQNLATADTQTKAVVKAVVNEVTKVETVAELNEEEKEAVGEVLGFDEETAAEDVEIIAEAAAKEENIATAVEEYVERAIESKDVENFTLADVVTEVQVEAFLENPIGELVSVNIVEMDLGSIGDDMTSDQRQKSKEVVVPIIIASQIVSQAGALIRRF